MAILHVIVRSLKIVAIDAMEQVILLKIAKMDLMKCLAIIVGKLDILQEIVENKRKHAMFVKSRVISHVNVNKMIENAMYVGKLVIYLVIAQMEIKMSVNATLVVDVVISVVIVHRLEMLLKQMILFVIVVMKKDILLVIVVHPVAVSATNVENLAILLGNVN